ncbi:MAG: DUF4147 domain-containing protein [Patescibacteria group bacterium]
MARKIKNFDTLAKTDMRRAALEIVESGLQAVDTDAVIRKNIRLEDDVLSIAGQTYLLKNIRRVFVVAVGKCAVEASVALERILGEKITSGVLIDVKDAPPLKKIKAFKGTHPLPSEGNVLATREMVSWMRGFNEHDLVIFVISGGGSTLLCLPEETDWKNEGKIVNTLMRSGATIQEINTVRKHLSLARGGFFAQYAYPAEVVSLIFSDVPGNDVQFVASGPTVQDTTTLVEADEVIKKYRILELCGLSEVKLIETPKDERYFEKVKNIIVVSNRIALEAMRERAEQLGFNTIVAATRLTGEAREVGARIMEEISRESPQTVLLYGGETTVNVHGTSMGGRNLELTLSAVLNAHENSVIVAIDSDGRDNSDFAGGLCDIDTKRKAETLGLDPQTLLDGSKSYEFFLRTGDSVVTGDTGSNIADIILALHY